MSSQLETVEAQALKLTAEERAQLADRLLASLFEDHEVEEAWAVEVERRITEIEGGRRLSQFGRNRFALTLAPRHRSPWPRQAAANWMRIR